MNNIISIVLALLAVSGLHPAQEPGCSRAQASAAEDGIDHLKSWSDLHSAFKQFRASDDGGIGEGWGDDLDRTPR